MGAEGWGGGGEVGGATRVGEGRVRKLFIFMSWFLNMLLINY